MRQSAQTWRLSGFRDHFRFVHEKMLDHSFAWVLGAGASKSSGIPTGGDLVERWLRGLHSRLAPDNVQLREWATAENMEIENFTIDHAPTFYPQIYQRTFRDHVDEGYAFLEDLMTGKDPSPGYSILAKILESQRHRLVITTNFDNLVADALSIYTDTFPFVCGHESLTSFVRVAMRRPLICKIHRDLLLGPQNEPRSLKRLHDNWGAVVRALLAQFTPIFIGYGGNDDTLMDLLESLEPGEIKGQLIWCYYETIPPNQRIQKLVAQHKGALVPSPDFDLLMVLLGATMGIEPLDEVIEQRAKDRATKYRERILDLDTTKHPDVDEALASIIERAGGSWAWQLKATREKDVAKKQYIYERGITMFPRSAELLGTYARFLAHEVKDQIKAGELYEKARAANPQSPRATADLANYLASKENYDEAETLYRRALSLDPHDVDNLTDFAHFLAKRKKQDEAEQHYRRALSIPPNRPELVVGFAIFLERENPQEAERYYKRACELSPDDYQIAARFGKFLAIDRHDLAGAVYYYQQAADRAPRDLGYRLELAALLTRQGKYELALESLTDAGRNDSAADSKEIQKRHALYSAIINYYLKRDFAEGEFRLQALLDGKFKPRPNDIGLDNLRQLVEDKLDGLQRDYYLRLIADVTGTAVAATTQGGNSAASSNIATAEIPVSSIIQKPHSRGILNDSAPSKRSQKK